MKRRNAMAVFTALALGVCSLGQAAEPKPAPFVRASISSLDEANAFLTELALPIHVDPKAMLERSFPFFQGKGMLGDKPVGVVFVAGDNMKAQEHVVFAFPVAADVATIESLVAMGATPVPEHADMVSMRGALSLRRTANYLLVYPGAADVLGTVEETTITKDYAKPGHMATVSLDLAAARVAAPETCKTFLRNAVQARQAFGARPGEEVGQKIALEAMQSMVDKLDRVTFAMGRDKGTLRLELWALPVTIAETPKFPRPAFPAGVMAQMHVVYPSAEAANWITALIEKAPFDERRSGTKATPEQANRIKAAMLRLSKQLLVGDAQSVGVEVKAGKPTVYLVNQYAKEVDVAKELPAIVKELNTANQEVGDGDLLALTSYQTAGGKSVSRLDLLEKGRVMAHVDVLGQGKVVTLAIAQDEGHHVEAVAGLPATGMVSSMCSGSFDFGAALKAAEESGAPLPLPEAQLAELRKVLAGQAITWVAKSNAQGKYLYVNVDVPMAVLKQVSGIAGALMMQRPGRPAEPTPTPWQ